MIDKMRGPFLRLIALDNGIKPKRGESDKALRRRILEVMQPQHSPGTKAAILQAIKAVVPSYVRVELDDDPGRVMIRLDEPIWRRVLFLARRDRRIVRVAMDHVVAAFLVVEVT